VTRLFFSPLCVSVANQSFEPDLAAHGSIKPLSNWD
jgi:hypothetical protein